MKEGAAERGLPSCVAQPAIPSFYLATSPVSHPARSQTKTERRPSSPQIWHPQWHLDVSSSHRRLLREPRPLMSRVSKNRGNINFEGFPEMLQPPPRNLQHQQQLSTQRSSCHLAPFSIPVILCKGSKEMKTQSWDEVKNEQKNVHSFSVISKYIWGPFCTFCSVIVFPAEHMCCSCSGLFYSFIFSAATWA